MSTVNVGRLPLGLWGLWERAEAACPQTACSPILEFAFGGKWLAALLEGGACARAFTFTGEHAVHGPLGIAAVGRLSELVGMPAREAFAALQAPAATERFGRLAGVASAALLNAVSSPLCSPESLAAGGLAELEDCVGRLVRPSDCVTVIGAGMFLDELDVCGARVDVCDLRPPCDLVGMRVTASGARTFPENLAFHDNPAETPGLLEAADVAFVTGSTLVNGTFFDLAPRWAHAREVVMFGPSGAAPFEALAELGVTCVASSRVLDPARFMDDVARRRSSPGAVAPFTVALPRPS